MRLTLLFVLILSVYCGALAAECKAAQPGLIWAQVLGNQYTKYAPQELLPEEVVKAVSQRVHLEFHNITDVLYSSLDHSAKGVELSQVYRYPPPSRVLFMPLDLPTEIIRIPTLRKRLVQFVANVSRACLSEYRIIYADYQQPRVPAGVEDVAREASDELWVLSQSHVTQLITRGVPPERLHIMPLVIDTSRFGPHVTPATLPLSGRCQFRVLSLIEARWGSGASALIRAFTTAFGSGTHPDSGACLILLDTTRNAPFDAFRALVLDGARAAGLRSDMYDNVLVAHADPADPAVHPARLLRTADVVVVPTRDGVVGTLVMEAMATGKPVFTTRWGEQASAVTHGDNGFTIPCTETRVTHNTPLAEADERAGLYVGARVCEPEQTDIVTMLRQARATSPRTLSEIGDRARAHALRHFDKSLLADRIAKRLSELPASLRRCD